MKDSHGSESIFWDSFPANNTFSNHTSEQKSFKTLLLEKQGLNRTVKSGKP